MLVRCQNSKAELPIQENLPPLPEWRRISYHDLAQAADGFSQSNLLGVESFGSVYKGTLSTGMTIAVKVFHVNQDRAVKSFDIECEVLRNIRRRNLVKIINSCSNVEFKALVLEFMPNRSLEKWLYSQNHFLNVLQRLNIVIDIALAVEYLHHDHSLSVVHCDIKPNNILLETEMVAHLGDFGIAKLLGKKDSMIQTKILATIGCIIWIRRDCFYKSDVYSFGIPVMETFTRKKRADDMFGEEMNLKRWVKESLPSYYLVDVVDSKLLNTREREGLAAKDCKLFILQLALECSAEVAEERTDMEEVVARLKKIKTMYLHGTEQV
ncbi:receptor kinase-like protein Xa21 [Gossypium arboreum]|nr:receptor kinase-like protein Xa21 [Gossypium arboreum]